MFSRSLNVLFNINELLCLLFNASGSVIAFNNWGECKDDNLCRDDSFLKVNLCRVHLLRVTYKVDDGVCENICKESCVKFKVLIEEDNSDNTVFFETDNSLKAFFKSGFLSATAFLWGWSLRTCELRGEEVVGCDAEVLK